MKVRNIALALAAGTAITVAAVAYAQPGGSGMGGYGGGMIGGTEPRANMDGQRATIERPLDEGSLRR